METWHTILIYRATDITLRLCEYQGIPFNPEIIQSASHSKPHTNKHPETRFRVRGLGLRV